MYKLDELRKKTDKELLILISDLKGKLLALRFENATGQLNESHIIKATKKDIAKVFTILNERKYNLSPRISEELNLPSDKKAKTPNKNLSPKTPKISKEKVKDADNN